MLQGTNGASNSQEIVKYGFSVYRVISQTEVYEFLNHCFHYPIS